MNFREEFWTKICRYAQYYYLLLALLTVLLVLNLFALLLGPPNEGTYVVTVVNFVILGVGMVGIAVILWQCQRM